MISTANGRPAGGANKNQERSERTRERLLEATLECLIERGYARCSTQEICDRAGLSRGAQLHHFPTKAALMASAVEHLAQKQVDTLVARAKARPPADSFDPEIFGLIWSAYSGPLAKASLELWIAASSDSELRRALVPFERRSARTSLELIRGYLPAAADSPQLETVFWLTVNLARGLALDELLGGEPARREHLLATWARIAREALTDVPDDASDNTTSDGKDKR